MIHRWIDRLFCEGSLPKEGYLDILSSCDMLSIDYLHQRARERAQECFGRLIFLRALIEITSYCRNDCYYCGIRRSNLKAECYRLSKDEVLECCDEGYRLGLRTFVLQGGEDAFFSDDVVSDLVCAIHSKYPDCAITLSLGERSKLSYERFFESGASRYLLRHESINPTLYSKLHPKELSLGSRVDSLQSLKQIGYQVGTGFMVGAPHQTIEDIVEDIEFIERFRPHMVGIGPFVAHSATPFSGANDGSVDLTLRLISIFRLINPQALIPSTTALATLDKMGHARGVSAGANVIMPNFTPQSVRKKYAIYDNKAAFGSEAGQGIEMLRATLKGVGYDISYARGDSEMD